MKDTEKAEKITYLSTSESAIAAIALGLATFFADDQKKIAYWLLEKNPNFGYASPAELIALRGEKGLQKVAQFVLAAVAENRA